MTPQPVNFGSWANSPGVGAVYGIEHVCCNPTIGLLLNEPDDVVTPKPWYVKTRAGAVNLTS